MYSEEILTYEVILKNGNAKKSSHNGYGVQPSPKKEKARNKIKGDLKVFLVDDDKVFLNTLHYYLSDSLSPQIEIKTFSNAEDCLKEMKEKPTIIVLDYMLFTESSKGMDGLSALKKINRISPETFVIILSAQDSIDIAIETLKEGAYDYLSKSETAFIRLKTMIKNIMETILQTRKQEREELIARRINLFVILFLIVLFIISRIVK